MAWRLARSLEVLRGEVLELHPGTTVWTIGDADHAATWSATTPTVPGWCARRTPSATAGWTCAGTPAGWAPPAIRRSSM